MIGSWIPTCARVAAVSAGLLVMFATTAQAAPQPLTKALAKQAVSRTVNSHYSTDVGLSIRCKRIAPNRRKASCPVSFYIGDNVYSGTVTVVLVRDKSGRFVRGRGTFSGEWTSDYPDCRECSGHERWSERFTLSTPPQPPTPPAQPGPTNLDFAIFTTVSGCHDERHPENDGGCLVKNYDKLVAGGSIVPYDVLAAVDAAYVAHTATPVQSAFLDCWLSWRDDSGTIHGNAPVCALTGTP